MDRAATFKERLRERTQTLGGSLCVGIDPVAAAMPQHLERGPDGVRRYCLELVEAVAPYACAIKPNAAFFETLGDAGWRILKEVVAMGGRHSLVVVDGKRGDIGHTAGAYAEAVFDCLGADACTVNGYLGRDSVQPFLNRPDRLAFIICRTSNPGAADLQDLFLAGSGDPLYLVLARLVAGWAAESEWPTAGLVAGATWPSELSRIRDAAPDLPLLVPGIGAQGGDLRAAVAAAAGRSGTGQYLINVSRGVCQASSGPDFAEAAALAARNYLAAIAEVEAGLRPVQARPDTSTL